MCQINPRANEYSTGRLFDIEVPKQCKQSDTKPAPCRISSDDNLFGRHGRVERLRWWICKVQVWSRGSAR